MISDITKIELIQKVVEFAEITVQLSDYKKCTTAPGEINNAPPKSKEDLKKRFEFLKSFLSGKNDGLSLPFLNLIKLLENEILEHKRKIKKTNDTLTYISELCQRNANKKTNEKHTEHTEKKMLPILHEAD